MKSEKAEVILIIAYSKLRKKISEQKKYLIQAVCQKHKYFSSLTQFIFDKSLYFDLSFLCIYTYKQI